MENRFYRASDERLMRNLYVDTFEVANLKWSHAYITAYKSVYFLDGDGKRFDERHSLDSISKLITMILAVILMVSIFILAIPIGTFDQRLTLLPYLAVTTIVTICLLRLYFYHNLRRELLFAENRRLALEQHWPGITRLVSERILDHDFRIPEDPVKTLNLGSKLDQEETLDFDIDLNID